MIKEIIDIENMLIWVYQKQKADVLAGRGVGLLDIEASVAGIRRAAISGDGCASVARNEELGVRVDSFGRDRGDLHPDAELVHELVLSYPAFLRGLIIGHAKAGTRPNPMVGIKPRMEPVRNTRGRLTKIWNSNRNWIGCEVRPVNLQENIDHARNMYIEWRCGINALAQHFLDDASCLIRYSPKETKAPVAPWIGR